MAIDIGDIGGEVADWGGDVVIDRDIILDLIIDFLHNPLGDIPPRGDLPRVTEFVDVRIASLGERKGLAPSSKELTALRKAIVDRVNKAK